MVYYTNYYGELVLNSSLRITGIGFYEKSFFSPPQQQPVYNENLLLLVMLRSNSIYASKMPARCPV